MVRVRATTVNSGRRPDPRDAPSRAASRCPGGSRSAGAVRGGRSWASSTPGMVEAVGAGVTGLTVGDEVCGMTGTRMGAHAELAAVRADRLWPCLPVSRTSRPPRSSSAAARPATSCATWSAPGKRVLVNGASGAVGKAAVQLAHLAGAHVTARLQRAQRRAWCARWARTRWSTTPGRRSPSWRRGTTSCSTPSATSTGARVAGCWRRQACWCSPWRGSPTPSSPVGNVRAGVLRGGPANFAWLLERIAAGELRAVVDRTLPLGRDRRGAPRRRLRPQGRQPRRHAMTWRAAAAVPGVGHQRAIAADWPSVHVELHTQ